MKRPYPITVTGWLFIITGVASLGYHLAAGKFDRWSFLIAAVPIVGIGGALCLMRGHGWARWLLLVWLAFHVVMSAFHSWSLMLSHLVLSVAIGYAMLTPPASDYFRSRRSP